MPLRHVARRRSRNLASFDIFVVGPSMFTNRHLRSHSNSRSRQATTAQHVDKKQLAVVTDDSSRQRGFPRQMLTMLRVRL